MTRSTTPDFKLLDAEEFARDLYGLTVKAAPLPSERDQNFALQSAKGEKYILKISKSDEDRAVLEFQNAALRHLHDRVSSLDLPRLLPSKDGQEMNAVSDPEGVTYLTRLVTWIEGNVLGNAAPYSPKLLASLGRAIALLDEALKTFSHPAMHRELHWDLQHLDLALLHLRLLSADQVRLVEFFRSGWERLPWQELRRGVIHGDLNDLNVLARHQRVSGFIDFGDMVHSAVVCDLAIAVAYTIMNKDDPLATIAAVTAAYNELYPLSEAEIEALFALVTGRLCMSVCYAAYNAVVKSGDAYQTIHAESAWKALAQLRKVPPARALGVVRAACGHEARILAARRRLFGGNLSLSYDAPLNIVRGSMQYLYDESGRRFLDAYNNVPHVGHCHPKVVEAGYAQLAVLNTNTRYLNELVHNFAERLVGTLPGALKVCFFVNSGSEANELALRLARTYSGQQDLIVLEQAYHGNTTTLMDISPYKDGGDARRRPAWVHVAALPDLYRGPYKRGDPGAGRKYAQSVTEIIERLRDQRRGLAGFIAESWPSVGGQLDLPAGYLPEVYEAVRRAGGVCIADEVQTGYGRVGQSFWGFENYGVVPDIVAVGKPIGNGHPLGAVITTPAIAASFDNGIEFFSTFGGNTVSCAIGLAVLEVVIQEQLQLHALQVGERLLRGLKELMTRHPIIGNVRGSGLFLGLELVRDQGTLEPATAETHRIVNEMKSRGVLIGSEGPAHNVLKIRPPMPFNSQDGDFLLVALEESLRALN
jgi:4-aminobutyrate aminotransferase-like enzyme/Ser/Thr protein kinase RdoA (MazF antagonist)